MTAVWMAAIVALAAFGVVTTIVRLAARPLERAALRLAGAGRCRSGDLLILRLLPLGAAAIVVCIFVLPAFVRFEPRGHEESAGAPIVALAAVGAALLASAGWRMVRDVQATRRLVRIWLARARSIETGNVRLDAFAVDTPEPLVAITGFVRHRLFLSERVLAACKPGELAAVIAHEHAHARTYDNLRCLLVRACVGAWRRGRNDHEMERAWSAAVEHDADEYAIRAGVAGVDLASALVNVVRLGQSPLVDAPVSAFHEGDDLQRRVGRALGNTSCGRRPRLLQLTRAAVLALPLAALAAAASPGALLWVHEAVERAIAFMR
jgi:Peptidase family M48